MLYVCCAIIQHNDKVLICQRSTSMSNPLKWEFPGGKKEFSESDQDCLRREIKEELGLLICIGKSLRSVEHTYDNFKICLHPYLATLESGDLKLSEHAKALWVDISSLTDFDFSAADIPIVRELEDIYH